MMDLVPNTSLEQDIIDNLRKVLPPVFARKDIPRFFGRSIATGTLANLGLKFGPPYVRRGRNAIYEKESFLTWFQGWLTGEDKTEQ